MRVKYVVSGLVFTPRSGVSIGVEFLLSSGAEVSVAPEALLVDVEETKLSQVISSPTAAIAETPTGLTALIGGLPVNVQLRVVGEGWSREVGIWPYFYFVPDTRDSSCVSWALGVLRREGIIKMIAESIREMLEWEEKRGLISEGLRQVYECVYGYEREGQEIRVSEDKIERMLVWGWNEFNYYCYLKRKEEGWPPLLILSLKEAISLLERRLRKVEFDESEGVFKVSGSYVFRPRLRVFIPVL